MREDNCFLTLTYDDLHCPENHSLVLRDIQLFCKRLRKKIGKFRFFHAGEYGNITHRPHYHMCIFGYRPSDVVLYKKTEIGHALYTSKIIDETWGLGRCWIGDVSFDSAAYVARYIVKKVTGERAEAHYAGRKPEYTTMSRRPGIGDAWLKQYASDVYRHDELVLRGKRMRAPRAYDRRLELSDPTLIEKIKRRRRISAIPRTQESLDVSAEVKLAQIKSLRRGL